MTQYGQWRLYFNRLGAHPLMWWCVSPEDGSFEVAVRAFEVHGVASRSVYQPKETPDDEDGRPSGWVACEGTLTIEDGIARVRP